jgi:methionine sulfoxide reductase heme-binding subunit
MTRLSPYWLWLVMSLPAVAMFHDYFTTTAQRPLRALLGPSGEWATYFLLIALAATPLVLLLPGWRVPRWLVRNRRYFGVAAFLYGVIHLGAYLARGSDLATLLAQALQFDLATGWVAFLIMVPLAATSADYAVRRMGRNWKALQRWAYPAAVLTLLHWASVEDWRNAGVAVAFFLPLAALTAYRAWWNLRRARPARAS